MGFGILILVNGLKSNECSLSTLHHGEPCNEEPKDEKGKSGMNSKVCRCNRLVCEHCRMYHKQAQDEKCRRVEILEGFKRSPKNGAWSLRVFLSIIDQLLLRIIGITWVVSWVTLLVGNWKNLSSLVIYVFCRLVIRCFVCERIRFGIMVNIHVSGIVASHRKFHVFRRHVIICFSCFVKEPSFVRFYAMLLFEFFLK